MNNIKQYIIEKLHLNKDINIDNTYKNASIYIVRVCNYKNEKVNIEILSSNAKCKNRKMINKGKYKLSIKRADEPNIKTYFVEENSNYIYASYQDVYHMSSDVTDNMYLLFDNKKLFQQFLHQVMLPLSDKQKVSDSILFKYFDKNKESFLSNAESIYTSNSYGWLVQTIERLENE